MKVVDGPNLLLFSQPAAQEVLESLKDRWFQADNPPADQLLNEEEFLSFLHPEHSRGMLKYMVKEIVRDLGMRPMPSPPVSPQWTVFNAGIRQTNTATEMLSLASDKLILALRCCHWHQTN